MLDIQIANYIFENEDTLKKKALWKGRHFEKGDTLKKRPLKKSSQSAWLISNLNIDYQGKTHSHIA